MREPLEYHQVLRAGRYGWRWSVLGLLSFALGMLVLAPLLVQVPFLVYFVASGQDVLAGFDRLVDLKNPTPMSLAYLNLVLAAAIPVTWLIIRTVHGLKPRWLSSVRPRLRWSFLLVCLALSFVSLIATLVVSLLLPAQQAGPDVTAELNDFTTTTRDFLLVVLFLTPLQAAGEEYAFRGYLTQVFGGVFGSRFVAVLVPSVLFALAHGTQSVPIFFDRFAFGVVAGTLVILTGGLEAGIAMHVLNNWFAFGLALAFGDIGSSLNPTGGSWWSIPVTLTQSLTYLVLALWVGRAMGLSPTTEPAVLERSRGRV